MSYNGSHYKDFNNIISVKISRKTPSVFTVTGTNLENRTSRQQSKKLLLARYFRLSGKLAPL